MQTIRYDEKRNTSTEIVPDLSGKILLTLCSRPNAHWVYESPPCLLENILSFSHWKAERLVEKSETHVLVRLIGI